MSNQCSQYYFSDSIKTQHFQTGKDNKTIDQDYKTVSPRLINASFKMHCCFDQGLLQAPLDQYFFMLSSGIPRVLENNSC